MTQPPTRSKSMNPTRSLSPSSTANNLPAQPDRHIVNAKMAGNKADGIQDKFRRDRTNPIAPSVAGGLKRIASVVMAKNNELAYLAASASISNVKTPLNGATFWSGDNIAPGKAASAMLTAQHIAKRTGGQTVEQTTGGKALDQYAGHPNSFGYLQARFAYLPPSQRAQIMTKGANSAGLPSPPAGRQPRGSAPHPLANLSRGSTAGALWNVISARFAQEAVGEAQVIHAAPSSDAYFASTGYARSTFKTIEEPTLRSKGVKIREQFGEQLAGDLQQPRRGDHTPDYVGTGGRRPSGLNKMGSHSSSGTLAKEGIFPTSPEPKGPQRGTQMKHYGTPIAHPKPFR
jgi:hypothetical protein